MNHVLRVIDAYRPLALALAAIFALVAVVPGADLSERFGTAQFDRADSSGPDRSASNGDPVGSVPDDAPTDTPAAPEEPSESSFTVAAPDYTATPSSPGGSSATSPAPYDGTSTETGTTDASAGDDTGYDLGGDGYGGDDTGSSDDADGITIAAFGWASTVGGTPLSEVTDEVPEDTLPVGTRVTQHDKISFVRLSGDGSALVLDEVEDGRRGDVSEPVVRACQITDADWESGPDQPMSDAPAHDTEACVDAQIDDDGTWRVPLGSFEDPTDDRGLALIPIEDPPVDFQVTFATEAAA